MVVSREKFIASIKNIENAYIIQKENNALYLISDMEYGGADENARIEEMCFLLNQNLPFQQAVSECRSNYCGGISFIEYEKLDARELAVADFMNLKNNSVSYLISDKENAVAELRNSNGEYFYIYIDNYSIVNDIRNLT